MFPRALRIDPVPMSEWTDALDELTALRRHAAGGRRRFDDRH
jgi:hypothetical protein